MRKLIMKMSMTLDGFVGSPGGGNDWVFKTGDAESRAYSVEALKQAGTIIMGRKSFDGMAGYWPVADSPFAAPMNEIPKAVFTQKGYAGFKPGPELPPSAASWAEARIFDGDLVEGIKQLKGEEGKPIIAIGGAGFMQNLISTGLIDEYWLAVHPVVLGSGFQIFTNLTTPHYLKLVSAKVYPTGIIGKIFQPA